MVWVFWINDDVQIGWYSYSVELSRLMLDSPKIGVVNHLERDVGHDAEYTLVVADWFDQAALTAGEILDYDFVRTMK